MTGRHRSYAGLDGRNWTVRRNHAVGRQIQIIILIRDAYEAARKLQLQ